MSHRITRFISMYRYCEGYVECCKFPCLKKYQNLLMWSIYIKKMKNHCRHIKPIKRSEDFNYSFLDRDVVVSYQCSALFIISFLHHSWIIPILAKMVVGFTVNINVFSEIAVNKGIFLEWWPSSSAHA